MRLVGLAFTSILLGSPVAPGGARASGPDTPVSTRGGARWEAMGATPWSVCVRWSETLTGWVEGRAGAREAPDVHEALRRCPQEPQVLLAAVVLRLTEPVADAFSAPEATSEFTRAIDEHVRGRREALRWLQAARLESGRRGDGWPPSASYLEAQAWLSLGEVARARAALERARGHVEAWRSDRLLALCALFAGDLAEARRLSWRAVEGSPLEDRGVSLHVRVLVLDRVGSSEAPERSRELRTQDPIGRIRDRYERVLPVHERLYARALYHMAIPIERGEAIRYFTAYLARPEPTAAERVWARRHLADLRQGIGAREDDRPPLRDETPLDPVIPVP